MGDRWYGNRKSFFIPRLFCLLSSEEGQLAFSRGFRKISTVRLFIVSHGTILVLLFGLLFRFLPSCVAHITSVALVAVWLSFAELVVGGLAWRFRWGSVVRICGIRRCAEVYGVFLTFVGNLTFGE